METGAIFVIFFVIGLVVLFRLLAGGLDSDRVREYVESRGGRLLESHWAPFGTGWFGTKNERIYEVRYLDKDGNEHEATCKTSMMAGVYWTEDKIVRYARQEEPAEPAETGSLEEENRRLREEIERLRQKGEPDGR